MDPTPNKTNKEHKLLIEYIYSINPSLFKPQPVLIRNKPYKVGLYIKNIDDSFTPAFSIKGINFRSGEGTNIEQTKSEELYIDTLNPGESCVIWWPDKLNMIMKGQLWVNCKLTPNNIQDVFYTYQWNRACMKEFEFPGNNNSWGNVYLVRDELKHQQLYTNYLLLFLTALILIDSVFGLDNVARIIYSSVARLLFPNFLF